MQLRQIDEKQNIDMALVMGGSTERSPRQEKDQMKIPNRPSMRLGRERTLSKDLAAVGSLVSISRATSLPGRSVRHCMLSKPLQLMNASWELQPSTIHVQDSRPNSPRDQIGSQSDDESSRGAPNLVRKSLAMIKKVLLCIFSIQTLNVVVKWLDRQSTGSSSRLSIMLLPGRFPKGRWHARFP